MHYPNPMFVRDRWLSLNGRWEFEFDDANKGLKDSWVHRQLAMRIDVPFVYQSKMANLSDRKGKNISYDGKEPPYHPIVWYKRTFELDAIVEDEEVLLHFNAVDYKAHIWINGQLVTIHEGGYTPFQVAISAYVKQGTNDIAVRVEDYHDHAQPRGKQIWTEKPWGCWYTASSGIWKDVWLSFTNKAYITACRVSPDLDKRVANIELEYSYSVKKGFKLEVELSYENSVIATTVYDTEQYRQYLHLHITQPNGVDDIHAWSPERPQLYDLKLRLYSKDMILLDEVGTHFGMRKISVRNNQILLNNRPLYQRLILDQGYWEESLLTPPTKDALKKDLELIKAMGFNGIRKHQKVEDPWFYYLADKMGLLVWAELPSPYSFSTKEVENVQRDMTEMAKALFNHPSIITWVPFNESWGIRDVFTDAQQQNFVKSIYYLLKTLDPSRLISGNDGWEQPITDFCAIHDYDLHDEAGYERKWADFDKLMKSTPSKRQVYTQGSEYQGEPVMITEFGGVALQEDVSGGAWGYRNPATTKDELLERLERLLKIITADDRLQGYCYTQLTDVFQEVNGLLYPDRTPKCELEAFRRIFAMKK